MTMCIYTRQMLVTMNSLFIIAFQSALNHFFPVCSPEEGTMLESANEKQKKRSFSHNKGLNE